jgi:hypothetical protein
MDIEAVERIISAVGYAPPDFDRNALCHDLDWSHTWYETAKKHGSDGRRRNKRPQNPEPEWAAKAAAQLAAELSLSERSPLDWLVGKHLPELFEKYFGVEAGLGRNPETKKLNSPYLRFASSSLNELSIKKKNGEPYSMETIARAVTFVRASQPRRLVGK